MISNMTKNSISKSWPSTRLLDIPVDCPERSTLLDALINHAQQGQSSCQVVTMNAEMAYAATQDKAFFEILQQADVIIPDGIGVVWALGHAGIKVARLPGVELVEALFRAAPTAGLRLAILGSSPETLAAFEAQIPERFGDNPLVYRQDGYFKPAEETRIIEELRQSQAQILFVALGVPRQEAWIARYRKELGIPVIMGVGGSFDVLSGRLQRAPVWMRKAHLEWLYRLYQQPSRWRRMLALPQFVMKVLRT